MKPYLTGDAAGAQVESGALDRDFGGDFGVDAKVGITSGLTADLTWNTDFAQVEADAQQINLTRFSLFFPEKREFFLEGQGLFAFGTSERTPRASSRRFGAPSSVPLLFFSRRIGIAGNQVAPIRGGARVTGKLGAFGVGALAVRSGESVAAGVPETDFSVFRLKRDILGRSTVGVMGTYRSGTGDGRGSNAAYGMDARFGFYENLDIRSYAAWTQNEHDDRTGMSYRGQLDYQADRYGLQFERPGGRRGLRSRARLPAPPGLPAQLRGGALQSPAALDLLAAEDRWDRQSRLHHGQRRESGNPDLRAPVRRPSWRTGTAPSSSWPGTGRCFTRNSGWPATLRWPPAPTTSTTPASATGPGPSGRSRGPSPISRAGSSRGPGANSPGAGRLEVVPHLIVEPIISLNWIALPDGDYDTRLVASRINYNLSPRSFLAAFLQYKHRREQPFDEYQVPLGVSAGQRHLSRLQLGPRHPDARLSRTRHAGVHRQVHASLPLLTFAIELPVWPAPHSFFSSRAPS